MWAAEEDIVNGYYTLIMRILINPGRLSLIDNRRSTKLVAFGPQLIIELIAAHFKKPTISAFYFVQIAPAYNLKLLIASIYYIFAIDRHFQNCRFLKHIGTFRYDRKVEISVSYL